MRSLKAIQEDIDQLGAEAHKLDRLAKQTGGPTEGDVKRLERILAQLEELDEERTAAKRRDQQILSLSKIRDMREGKYMGYPLTLPTNGVLPSEENHYNPLVRSGPLKAFRDEQTAYDSGKWLQAVVSRMAHGTINERAEDHCRSKGLLVTNTSHEGSGTAGGYTVPAPVTAAIINILETVGVARRACRVLPATSDTLSVPKKTGGLTAYVVPETVAMTASDPTWGLVSGAVKKRAVLSYISQELSDDSLIGMADFIFSEMAYALALKEDDELINGDGSSTDGGIQGLIASIGSAGVYTTGSNDNLWSEIDLNDCIQTIGKLPDRYFTYGPKWICSFAFYNQVMARLAYGVGGVTMAEVMGGTGNVRSFLGYPVLLTSQAPTVQADSSICALFGAFDQAVLFADRGDMRLSRSDDFKFAEDLISLKATHRYDMTVHDAGDSSNAGAYVALKTNAA